MQLTLPILLLAAPVLGNVFYDAPFIEEPGLVTRTISNGPHCVSTFQTHQDSTNPPHQCSELQAKLGSQVSFPGSATFIREQNDIALGYWSFQEQAVIPACRLTPKSTKDVSVAVTELAKLHCQFAIRGAGHMFWAGSANIAGGLTIDMSSFTSVSVSADRKTTSAGGGTRWSAIYSKLDAMGLAIVGGRVFDVGIGGLTLGGGNSWFAPRFGFVCDNIANFEVVLGSGEVVHANISSHPDLYKALKGGGNNFGVVTKFDFNTFEQGTFWGGFLSLPVNNSMTQLEFMQNFTTASGAGEHDFAAIESVHAYNATGQTALASIITYTKPEGFPAIFRNLTDIQPQIANDLRITNLSDLTAEAGAGIGNGGRYVWATGTFANNATILAKVNELAQATFSNLTTRNGNFTFSNVFQPIPRSITSKSAATGDNVLGLHPREGDLIWMNFNAQYWDDADEEIIESATQKFINSVDEYTKSIGQFKPFRYMNYAYPAQEVIDSYGQVNVEFLRRVSRKYDPAQVFQRLVPGGYKLYRV